MLNWEKIVYKEYENEWYSLRAISLQFNEEDFISVMHQYVQFPYNLTREYNLLAHTAYTNDSKSALHCSLLTDSSEFRDCSAHIYS